MKDQGADWTEPVPGVSPLLGPSHRAAAAGSVHHLEAASPEVTLFWDSIHPSGQNPGWESDVQGRDQGVCVCMCAPVPMHLAAFSPPSPAKRSQGSLAQTAKGWWS
jgi:hypothetical protein